MAVIIKKSCCKFAGWVRKYKIYKMTTVVIL